jgi:recombinational DNA repair ATPase RecF
MKVTVTEINLKSFKNHDELNIKFGTLTTIRGINGSGKSSIGEAITWVLFGLDMMGSKLDPTMKGKESCFAAVLLDVDGKEILFNRELVKGTAKYYINDVPKKAKEYEETVKSICDKDLFLSLFNPSYFPSMHWNEQRSMLLSYVTAPANKEVFEKLPKLQVKALEAAL